MQALTKGPEITLQGHQALPQETPAVFAHGTEPKRPRLEPAGIYHVHSQQRVGPAGGEQGGVVVHAKIAGKPVACTHLSDPVFVLKLRVYPASLTRPNGNDETERDQVPRSCGIGSQQTAGNCGSGCDAAESRRRAGED